MVEADDYDEFVKLKNDNEKLKEENKKLKEEKNNDALKEENKKLKLEKGHLKIGLSKFTRDKHL